MLDTTTSAPATMRHPAIIQVLDGASPNLGKRCQIYHCDGWYEAWTWLDLAECKGHALYCGYATTMEISHGRTDFLLLGMTAEVDLPLSDLLPDDLCPIPGVVRQTTRLIDSLESGDLRRLLATALITPDALHGFWTSPASRRDHHAYPGGLAEHSLEIATMVATSSGLPSEDRELGIAFALLHDYGKVWCYDPWREEPIDSRDHEAFGLKQLRFPLDLLHFGSPELGARMEELLGGASAQRKSRYPQAIGRVVRAFDQMSCEKTRRTASKSRSTFDALDWA